MKPRILTAAPVSMDFVQRTESFPETGEEVTGTSYDYVPGGDGFIMAFSVTAFGGEAIMTARVGADMSGQRIRGICRDMNIDARFVTQERRASTGMKSVATTPSGERRTISYPGANLLLSSADAEDAFTSLPDAAIMTLEIPERTAFSVSEYAAKKHIPLVIDGSPARSDYPLSKLFPCEIFTCDERELETFTGIPPSSTESCLRSVIRLSSSVKAAYYVIKMGERGMFLYDGKYYNIVQPYSVTTVDRSAVGIIFTTAMATEYSRSKIIMRAVKYAAVASALSVMHPGAIESIPSEEEIDEFISERGITL